MNQAAAQHFELESSLRGALAREEFELFYQPIIDIGTRRVHTLEVLLRWRRGGTSWCSRTSSSRSSKRTA